MFLILSIIFISICFSSSSYFFISGPHFLSLILLFPSRCSLTRHPLPTPYSKQLKKPSPLEWNRKGRIEIEQKGGRRNLGRAHLVMLTTSPSSVGSLQSLPRSACAPAWEQGKHKGKGAEGSKGEALGKSTAEAVFKFSQVSICLGNYETGLCWKRGVPQTSFPTTQNPYPLESETEGKNNQNVSTWPWITLKLPVGGCSCWPPE